MRYWLSLLCGLALAGGALAGTVTLDMNGFPNIAGGQVTGAGLEKAILLPAKQAQVVLEGLQGNSTYQVDFFHNAGEGSSDFSFTTNADGTGVASVTKGGSQHEMIDAFVADQPVLKLKTFPVVYNANEGQTGVYFIQGLAEAYKLEAGKGAQTLTAIPGRYSVDNLYNAGSGNEDFVFLADDTGKVSAVESTYQIAKNLLKTRNGDEYAEYQDNAVSPRVAKVRLRIEASGAVNWHPTHRQQQVTGEAGTYEMELSQTVGSGGLNIWSFGKWEVTGGDAVLPDGQPAMGTKGENDYHFYPILRYDLAKKAFYFETLHGPDTSVIGEAKGFYDGNENPLSIKITATIIPAKPAEPAAGEEPAE